MERQEDIKPSPITPLKGEYIAIAIIIVFHLVGGIGLSIPTLQAGFLAFVPWHLLLMFAILFFSHKNINEKFILFVLTIFVFGYSVEWTGVHTHRLFGDYSYGKNLGIKLWGVPPIISVNWFLLTYSIGVLMQRTRLKSAATRILLGSGLLVVLDWLIEPVASRFNYWHWVNQTIPLTNYSCWFLVSGGALILFEVFHFKKQGIVPFVFLVCQFLFFGILYFVGNH